MQRVLVLGGYGAFGGRIAERLARIGALELMVAGRSRDRAEAFAAQLAGPAKIAVLQMDARAATARDIAVAGPQVLINASGPYQGQGYGLARACIAAGCHYIDLADARAHVAGIAALDAEARRAGVLVVAGASTVPALSGAVLDAYAPRFAGIDRASIVISPGNSFDPGIATTASMLGALGKPIATAGGRRGFGWQGLRRHRLPGLGGRWVGLVDVPDLDLFPQRYPQLGLVRVYAALEVGAFHLGLWTLSWLVRAGLLRNPARLAAPLLAAKRRLGFLGSDTGGMTVALEGRDATGAAKRLDWWLIARRGHGPFIPGAPSVILAKRLLAGTLAARGAMPCLGLFTLGDFLDEVADLDITAGIA